MEFEREVWQAFITNNSGDVQPNAQITVFDAGTSNLSTIYSGLTGAPRPNPFNTGSDGLAKFYAEPARYRVQAQTPAGIAVFDDVDLSQKALREDLSNPGGARLVLLEDGRNLQEYSEQFSDEALQQAVADAQSEADRAETAADVSFVNAGVYPDVISGRQDAADGEAFWVHEGAFLTLYRAEAGGLATPLHNFGSLGVARRKNLVGHISDGVEPYGSTFRITTTGVGSYIVPITGGKVYTMTAEFADRFRIYETSSFSVNGGTIDFVRHGDDKLGPHTITTDPSSNYLVIYARSVDGPDPVKVQVNEGEQLLEYTDPFSAENIYYHFTEAEKSGLGVSALESKLGFIVPKNLINPEKDYTNLFVSGTSSSSYAIAQGGGRGSYVCEVDEGVTYTASAHDGDRLIIVMTSDYPADGMDFEFVGEQYSGTIKTLTFTVSPGYKYALIFVKSNVYPEKPTMVQLEVGEDRTDFTPFNSPLNLYLDFTNIKIKLPETQNGSSIGDTYPLKNQLAYTEFSEQDVPESLVSDLTGTTTRDSLDTDYFISKYDALVSEHPQYVTKESLGLASDGSDLWMYRFSAPTNAGHANFRPPKVYMSSLIHGMEKWMGVSTFLFFDMLCNKWQTNDVLGALRLGVDFVVVPVLNPHGTTATSLPGYSDNTPARTNANGVDLNRNFPASWVFNPDTSSKTYSGPYPASEPETQIIMGLMDSEEIDFAMTGHNYSDFGGVNTSSVWWGTPNSKVERELSGLAVTTTRNLVKKYPSIYPDVLGFDKNVVLLEGNVTGGMEAMQWHAEGIKGCLFETSTGILLADNKTRAGLLHALDNTINTVVAGLKCLD